MYVGTAEQYNILIFCVAAVLHHHREAGWYHSVRCTHIYMQYTMVLLYVLRRNMGCNRVYLMMPYIPKLTAVP